MLRNHRLVVKALRHDSGAEMACPPWVASVTGMQMGVVLNIQLKGI
jgi:hypothetical protein